MRFLFAPMSWGRGIGAASRCLAIAHELTLKGHQCAVICNEFVRPVLHNPAFKVYDAFTRLLPTGSPPPLNKLADFADYLGLADESFVRELLAHEQRIMAEFSPDMVITSVQPTAVLAAKRLGIPTASTASWPDSPRFKSPLHTTPSHDNRSTELFQRLSVECGVNIQDLADLAFDLSDLKIAPTAPQLEPELRGIPNILFVGALLYTPLEWRKLPSWLENWDAFQPNIFVYLGQSEVTPEIYTQVLPETFDNTSYKVVVATGYHHELPRLPANTTNVSYARVLPGSAVMEKCSLVIFHGGHGTAMACLAAGVPSIGFPGLSAERDFNARALESNKVGIRLSTGDFTSITLHTWVEEILTNSSYRENTLRWKQIMRDLGGAKRAADLLVTAVNSRANLL